MSNTSFSKQVPKNLFVNILSFAITILVGLWLTPYLIKNLGIVAYGLIPLAMFLSQYVSIIINSINMSIGRFLLISIQKNRFKESNEIFNTSLIIISLFILIQSILMYIVIIDINSFFNIPQNFIDDAKWLFSLTFIGFSISLIRSIFATSIFSFNRLDILRTIDILQNIIRVLTILTFFINDKPSLKYVGIANLFASIISFIITFYFFKKFTPKIKINLIFFKKQRVLELSNMSIWILINQVGVLLLGNIDLYLVNTLIGTKATSEYAIIIQVTSLFKTLATLLGGILTPVIMIYYANEEYDKMKKAIIFASKLMIIFIIIPLSIVVYFSEPLISLWLGEKFSYLRNLISFALLYLIFSIPIMPLFNINISFNKVKLPALIVIFSGLINIFSIYILIKYVYLGLWGVLITKLIIEILYNSIFMPLYVANILNIYKFYFFKIPLLSIFIYLITYLFLYISNNFIAPESLLDIILYSVVFLFISIPLYIKLFFDKKEKKLLFNTLLKKISK